MRRMRVVARGPTPVPCHARHSKARGTTIGTANHVGVDRLTTLPLLQTKITKYIRILLLVRFALSDRQDDEKLRRLVCHALALLPPLPGLLPNTVAAAPAAAPAAAAVWRSPPTAAPKKGERRPRGAYGGRAVRLAGPSSLTSARCARCMRPPPENSLGLRRSTGARVVRRAPCLLSASLPYGGGDGGEGGGGGLMTRSPGGPPRRCSPLDPLVRANKAHFLPGARVAPAGALAGAAPRPAAAPAALGATGTAVGST